jgi:hypothetical protein
VTRHAAAVGARVAVGAIVAVAAVAAVAAVVVLGVPGHTAVPVAVSVPPAATGQRLVCDGPLLAIGRDASSASQVTVAADESVTTAVAPAASSVRQQLLSAPSVSASGAQDGPVLVTAPSDNGRAADLAAAASASVAAPDLSGFAASACAPALMQSWLVGGSSTTGAADLVVLANAGDVAATVQLSVYGPQGMQTPPGGTNVVVSAGTQRVIPLAGLVVGALSPVIRVTSSGAPVQASLQTSIVRTLVPGGVDQVGAIAAASKTVVIPGVQVQQAVAAGDAPMTTLRLMATTADTTATITVAPSGTSTAVSRQVSLTAGTPIELALAGLKAGTFTVTVTANAALVAAVWHSTGLDAGSDFAWFTPAPVLRAATAVAVPAAASGVTATLSVSGGGTQQQTVTLTPVGSGTGSPAVRRLTVPAGGSVTVPVVPGRGYVIDPGSGAGVRAAVSFAGAGAVAGFPIWSTDAASSALTVYP